VPPGGAGSARFHRQDRVPAPCRVSPAPYRAGALIARPTHNPCSVPPCALNCSSAVGACRHLESLRGLFRWLRLVPALPMMILNSVLSAEIAAADTVDGASAPAAESLDAGAAHARNANEEEHLVAKAGCCEMQDSAKLAALEAFGCPGGVGLVARALVAQRVKGRTRLDFEGCTTLPMAPLAALEAFGCPGGVGLVARALVAQRVKGRTRLDFEGCTTLPIAPLAALCPWNAASLTYLDVKGVLAFSDVELRLVAVECPHLWLLQVARPSAQRRLATAERAQLIPTYHSLCSCQVGGCTKLTDQGIIDFITALRTHPGTATPPVVRFRDPCAVVAR